jgi:hypothetical protein
VEWSTFQLANGHFSVIKHNSDWQRRMAEITGSELEHIKKRMEELDKQHELMIERRKKLFRP